MTAAVWAEALQFIVVAVSTISAFEGADKRILAVARQIGTTAFTVGTQFKHGRLLHTQ